MSLCNAYITLCRNGAILFLNTKGCGHAIPVRNEEISPCNFSINPLKNLRILKKKIMKNLIWCGKINKYVLLLKILSCGVNIGL